jgi:hypothetical protein
MENVKFVNGNDALVIIEGRYLTDFVVARGYKVDKETGDVSWGHGVYFSADADSREDRLYCLMKATEYMYSTENSEYITHDRMAEIATRFKDAMIEAWMDEDDAIEYVNEDLDMTETEKEFFELNEEEEN